MRAMRERRLPRRWPTGSTSPVSQTASCSPLHGDDFNDDLRRGATVADYQPCAAAPNSAPGDRAAHAAEFEAAARALTKPPDLHALGTLLGQLVTARLDPLPERQVLAAIKSATGIRRLDPGKASGRAAPAAERTGDIHHRPIRPRWARQLRLDLAGTPERNEANVITALSNDEASPARWCSTSSGRRSWWPGRCPGTSRLPLPRPWTVADDVRCAEWLQRREINVHRSWSAAASWPSRATSASIPSATT